MELKIESGIKLPESRGKVKGVLDQMKSGDSIYFNTESEAQSFYGGVLRYNKKPIRRKEGEGYRVWVVDK